jgi:dienelactone hydrolase
MSPRSSLSRRSLLGRLGLVPAAATLTSFAEAQARVGPPRIDLRDGPRDLKPSRAELGGLFEQVEKLAGKPRYPLSFLSGRYRDLDEFRARVRKHLFELLAYRPDKAAPKPEVVERVERKDHVREKVVFSTAPDVRVPAYVLLPKGRRRPAPAIVDLHSHGGQFLFGKEKVVDLGRNHPVMKDYHDKNYDGQPTATALVRRGYVVITVDALFFGERRLLLDEDLKYGWDRARYTRADIQHLNQKCRAKEATLVKALTLAGLTWPGIVAWDDIRTVDYLVSRPEVDARRVGCLGISMGGYRSTYLAALDERIKAACVVGFMSAVAPMRKAHLDIHSWVHFLPGLHRSLDLPDVASLAAPRHLLVQQCSRDRLFPPEGMKGAVKTIAAVYAKAGVKGRFSGRFYDEPHRFTRKMQEEAFAWFDKHLNRAD